MKFQDYKILSFSTANIYMIAMYAGCKQLDFDQTELFWQKFWDENKTFCVQENPFKKKYCVLDIDLPLTALLPLFARPPHFGHVAVLCFSQWPYEGMKYSKHRLNMNANADIGKHRRNITYPADQ
jgi:hypothetical protein